MITVTKMSLWCEEIKEDDRSWQRVTLPPSLFSVPLLLLKTKSSAQCDCARAGRERAGAERGHVHCRGQGQASLTTQLASHTQETLN